MGGSLSFWVVVTRSSAVRVLPFLLGEKGGRRRTGGGGKINCIQLLSRRKAIAGLLITLLGDFPSCGFLLKVANFVSFL